MFLAKPLSKAEKLDKAKKAKINKRVMLTATPDTTQKEQQHLPSVMKTRDLQRPDKLETKTKNNMYDVSEAPDTA